MSTRERIYNGWLSWKLKETNQTYKDWKAAELSVATAVPPADSGISDAAMSPLIDTTTVAPQPNGTVIYEPRVDDMPGGASSSQGMIMVPGPYTGLIFNAGT